MNDAPPPLFPASPQQPQNPALQAPPKSGCSKSGIGCGLGCLFAVGLCVALGIFGLVAAKNYFGKVIEEYTSFDAVPIEVPHATPEAIMQADNDSLEAIVRAQPEQWLCVRRPSPPPASSDLHPAKGRCG